MKTNILKFVTNFVNNPITNIWEFYKSRIRANAMWDSLEAFIKDMFCDSININDINEKLKKYEENFSFLWAQNNPPDIIIEWWDAIEVKKIEWVSNSLALNSSYPKDKLYSNSPMITDACKNCEERTEKDIMYFIWSVEKGTDSLKYLRIVYGDCYAAEYKTYEKIKNKISEWIYELPDIEFAETNELWRVNKVDPLGITNLRIRGMRSIENPVKVFDYVSELPSDRFMLNVLMLKTKYDTMPKEDKELIENLQKEKTDLQIKDIKIKSPNNPAKLIEAKMITFLV